MPKKKAGAGGDDEAARKASFLLPVPAPSSMRAWSSTQALKEDQPPELDGYVPVGDLKRDYLFLCAASGVSPHPSVVQRIRRPMTAVECRRFRRLLDEGSDRNEARAEALKATQGRRAREIAALDAEADLVEPDAGYGIDRRLEADPDVPSASVSPAASPRASARDDDSKASAAKPAASGSPRPTDGAAAALPGDGDDDDDEVTPPVGGESVAMDAFDLTTPLRRLRVSCSVLDAATVRLLRWALPYSTSLERLDLSAAALTAADVDGIRAALGVPGCRVASLALSHCAPPEGAGDGAASALRDAAARMAGPGLRLASVGLVGMGFCPGEGGGIGALAACIAAASPFLTALDVSENAFGDDGLAALMGGLSERTALRTLGLRRCGLSGASVATLVGGMSFRVLAAGDDEAEGAAGRAALGEAAAAVTARAAEEAAAWAEEVGAWVEALGGTRAADDAEADAGGVGGGAPAKGKKAGKKGGAAAAAADAEPGAVRGTPSEPLDAATSIVVSRAAVAASGEGRPPAWAAAWAEAGRAREEAAEAARAAAGETPDEAAAAKGGGKAGAAAGKGKKGKKGGAAAAEEDDVGPAGPRLIALPGMRQLALLDLSGNDVGAESLLGLARAVAAGAAAAATEDEPLEAAAPAKPSAKGGKSKAADTPAEPAAPLVARPVVVAASYTGVGGAAAGAEAARSAADVLAAAGSALFV